MIVTTLMRNEISLLLKIHFNPSMKTLALYFHPHPEKSQRSKLIVEELQKMENVTVRNIAKIYENTKGLIDTAEQILEEQNTLV